VTPEPPPPPRLSDGVVRVNPFDKQFSNSFCVPGGPALDTYGTVNFVTNQHNNEQQSRLSFSIVPHSLIPPSVGARSNLAMYIHNPTSCQPSKKAYQGVNAASTVTAAFATSSAASPMQISIYTNKRNTLASPTNGAKSSKGVVDLSGMDGGAAQILPVETIISKFLPQSATIIPNSSSLAGGAVQILQAKSINYKSQLNSAMKIHNSAIFAGGAGQIPQENAINDNSLLISAIGIHNPSSHAGGTAHFPKAHAFNDKSWPLIEGTAMKLDNPLISAGGAHQFPEPKTINDKY
jgi:hypothetical protein